MKVRVCGLNAVFPMLPSFNLALGLKACIQMLVTCKGAGGWVDVRVGWWVGTQP